MNDPLNKWSRSFDSNVGKELSRLSGSIMYFEKWSDIRKFQIRFEAVIAFQKI